MRSSLVVRPLSLFSLSLWSDILFLSDAPAELDAASESGMKVYGLIREDAIYAIHNHPIANNFDEVVI